MTTTTTTTPSTTTTPTTTSTSSSTSSSAATNAVSAQTLTGNYNTFLTLLTTQLQNQDPLDPLDTNQFTQQLVEFASVEQQLNMNTNLTTLIGLQQTTESVAAMQFLGNNVTLSGNAANLSNATGTQAAWALTTTAPATGTVTITSSTGQTAFSGTVSLNSGTQTFAWNGTGSDGTTWPDGTYTMAINATNASGQAVSVSTQVQGLVSSVNLSQNPPQVTVNGQNYGINQIQSISH